jgi:hypothetical protein
MPVTAAALKTPTGKIDPAFFPEDRTSAQLDARLASYIAEGVTLVADLDASEQDAATTMWAYYRAFEAVHLRMIATPASMSIADEGSVSFSSAQIASFGTMAASYKSSFEAMVAEEETIEPAIPSGGVTTKVGF